MDCVKKSVLQTAWRKLGPQQVANDIKSQRGPHGKGEALPHPATPQPPHAPEKGNWEIE